MRKGLAILFAALVFGSGYATAHWAGAGGSVSVDPAETAEAVQRWRSAGVRGNPECFRLSEHIMCVSETGKEYEHFMDGR